MATNADRPHGFPPVDSFVERPGYFRNYTKVVGYGTALGIYDLVQLQAAGDGLSVEQGAAGGPFLGVGYKHSLASTADTIPVELLARDNVCEAQTDGTLAAADAGLKTDIIVAAANAATGMSQMEVDDSTEATTATLDVFLLRPYPAIDNDVTQANSRWLVNVHDIQIAEAQAGV